MNGSWTFWTFHTAKCREHLEDPGAICICRPPAVEQWAPEGLEQLRRVLERVLRANGRRP